MIIKLYIKRISLLILILFLACVKGFSQGTEIIVGGQHKYYVGINFSPAHTYIKNNGSEAISELESTKKNSVFGSFEAGYLFSEYIGISMGISYNSYTTNLSLGTYSDQLDTTDADFEDYERRIYGSGIKETQKIGFISIPVLASFQLPVKNKFGLFLQTGLNFSIPVNKKYSSSGTFTYTGYYPAYKVLIADVPFEYFQSDVENIDDGNLKLKLINPEFIVSAGCHYFIQDKIQIALGFFINKMLSDVSGYNNTSSFILSSLPDHINSMMGGSRKASTQALGLKISVRYYLK